MTRRLASLVAAVFLFVSVPIGPASAAGATITQIGWWSQRPGASEQPAGGFEISLGPTGPLSQAALRVRVDASPTSALLELTESQAAGAEVASVIACPTTDTWEPANPGAWNEAPTPNCNISVTLSRRLSGEWVADIASLLRVGTVSVVLVPTSHPDTQGAPFPYQLVFSRAKLIASVPATPAPASPPPTITVAPAPADDHPPESEPAPETTPTPDETTPSPVIVGTQNGDDDDQPLAVDPAADEGRPRPWWRIVLLAPLAALIGGATVFARRTARERGWTA